MHTYAAADPRASRRPLPLPQPYTHPVRAPKAGEAPNPARQHPARVLHSFVDPAWRPSSSSSSSVGRTASSALGSTQTQTQPQGTGSALPLDSRQTLEALAPGRRGAWLLPISGPLPPLSPSSSPASAPHPAPAPSPPVYFSRAPPRPQRQKMGGDAARGGTRRLEWTDERLGAVWELVGRLGGGGAGGRGEWGGVRGSGWFPACGPQGETERGGEGEGEGDDEEGGEWPALLRIACPAHLALALRGLLGQVSVRAMAPRPRGAARGADRGDDEVADDDKFLKGRALLWVDEEGREVLIA